MNADEIRSHFDPASAMSAALRSESKPLENMSGEGLELWVQSHQVKALGEIAAQLAELNTHMAVIASVVQPAGKKWPAHITIARGDWNPDLDESSSSAVERS